ncbi:hypothetical protein SIAM614_01234 [Stappia aggregata IAM 12614]|uniref:Uncharacterized protein n=1 Tax=Roseibium aggregatum (strain ATCC 25650 / DSM 13394 / JCM 20685 / NBRC 16684 / NCIMB 2208 / IAM 12614 / B1) TaxID=384765 RepID=A0P0Q7_ROSAI|nr:hypothetical protein [Roseibium aggregatum]EAV41371.1 hypothetical protein SIAM614_01234 [Stappia aggregata IAM 12614] [Roseibium aggregatum IAM 12614]
MKALSPTGTKIIAVRELVPAHARLVSAGFSRDANGSLHFKYAPSGSYVFWDKQFITTNDEGQLWTEVQIKLGTE